MKTFCSKCSTVPASTKVGAVYVKKQHNREKGAYLEQDEITGFSEAIRSDPVLIDRFVSVPIGTVQTLANRTLDLLRTPWKEGLEEIIIPFFNRKF